ncbi:hypothetical protein FB451DRAFT_1437731 [Mycena latifolia]|nr:hypothetical protein FB451DRAFT_1437731 [Mycena latifolia]
MSPLGRRLKYQGYRHEYPARAPSGLGDCLENCISAPWCGRRYKCAYWGHLSNTSLDPPLHYGSQSYLQIPWIEKWLRFNSFLVADDQILSAGSYRSLSLAKSISGLSGLDLRHSLPQAPIYVGTEAVSQACIWDFMPHHNCHRLYVSVGNLGRPAPVGDGGQTINITLLLLLFHRQFSVRLLASSPRLNTTDSFHDLSVPIGCQTRRLQPHVRNLIDVVSDSAAHAYTVHEEEHQCRALCAQISALREETTALAASRDGLRQQLARLKAEAAAAPTEYNLGKLQASVEQKRLELHMDHRVLLDDRHDSEAERGGRRTQRHARRAQARRFYCPHSHFAFEFTICSPNFRGGACSRADPGRFLSQIRGRSPQPRDSRCPIPVLATPRLSVSHSAPFSYPEVTLQDIPASACGRPMQYTANRAHKGN